MSGKNDGIIYEDGLNHLSYHTENESLLEMIDKEFTIVNVIGEPSDGATSGYNISILDPRTKDEILEDVKDLQSQTL